MTREVLFLDLIETGEEEGAPPRMRLVVRAYPSDEKGYASLTPECDTMEGFEQAVTELKKTLNSALERARETFHQYQVQAKGDKTVSDFHNPEEIWQALEQCSSLEEMRELFNGLNESKRQEVADFVLTKLNIFKGAASTFSQHYNEAEFLLE
jgi:hypothetical protein